jgi:hypothetical protein
VLATTLPAAAKLVGVLAVLPFFGLMIALEGLARFSRSGSRTAALTAAAGFTVQCLSSEQIALLGTPLVLLAGVAALAGQGFGGRSARRLALAFAVALALMLPVLVPTIRIHRAQGFTRSERTVALGSATVRDFFTRPYSSGLTFPPRESLERDPSGLFPGILLLLLAGIGVVAGLKRRRGWTIALTVAAAAAAGLALGLNLDLLGVRPFTWLRAHVPGFAELRSPFRAAVVAQATLAVLAALGADAACRWFRGPAGRALVLGLGLLGALENLCIPTLLFPVPA